MGGGSKCYTPTPEVTIFVTILLLCILSFRQTLLYISQQKGQSVFLLNQHQRVMTGLVSDGHTIERYHKKYFAQTNNLTIARNVNKENRLCLVIYNPNAKHRRIANATTLGHIIKYIFGLFMLGPGVHFSFDVLPMGADQGSCAHKCVC